jgi:hypothetical protein
MASAVESLLNINPGRMLDVLKSGHVPVKAFVISMDPPFLPIPCQFNPNEITYSKRSRWWPDYGPGINVPKQQFKGGDADEMSMKLFFDTSEVGYTDVRLLVQPLIEMTKVNGIIKLNPLAAKRPSVVRFIWGAFSINILMAFAAYIPSITVNFTMFTPEGIPVRAEADVTFVAYKDPLSFLGQNPTSHTEPRSVHVVTVGETLDWIAHKHYGDSTRWRVIADANNIRNPLKIKPGTALKLPALDA